MKPESATALPAARAYTDGPRLLADIGASHARLALETAPGVLGGVAVLVCDEYAGIVPLLRAYLARAAGPAGTTRIQHAALALANPISGDFSTGASGLLIQDGQLGAPVREFTIASTLQRMLLDVLEVGGDIDWLPMRAAGVSLVIADMTMSGA